MKMNRYWKREFSGFIVTYKKSKFHQRNAMEFSIENMSDSIYDAEIYPMSAWDIVDSHINDFNEEYGKIVLSKEKIKRTIIIETENMFG